MRCAFCGYDALSAVLKEVLEREHTLVELFTSPMDGVYDRCDRVVSLAEQAGAPISYNRINGDDIARLKEKNTELLISAAYPFRIPVSTLDPLMGINVHPTLLPVGRGAFPIYWTILKGLSESGVTIHKLSHEFDQGDIILQERFPLDPETVTYELLMSRASLAAARAVARFLEQPERLWCGALPQGAAEPWPMIVESNYTISWDRPVAEIDRTIRAFGMFNSVATLNGRTVVIAEGGVWREQHSIEPGTVVLEATREIVVAAQDGFVCLRHWRWA